MTHPFACKSWASILPLSCCHPHSFSSSHHPSFECRAIDSGNGIRPCPRQQNRGTKFTYTHTHRHKLTFVIDRNRCRRRSMLTPMENNHYSNNNNKNNKRTSKNGCSWGRNHSNENRTALGVKRRCSPNIKKALWVEDDSNDRSQILIN